MTLALEPRRLISALLSFFKPLQISKSQCMISSTGRCEREQEASVRSRVTEKDNCFSRSIQVAPQQPFPVFFTGHLFSSSLRWPFSFAIRRCAEPTSLFLHLPKLTQDLSTTERHQNETSDRPRLPKLAKERTSCKSGTFIVCRPLSPGSNITPDKCVFADDWTLSFCFL